MTAFNGRRVRPDLMTRQKWETYLNRWGLQQKERLEFPFGTVLVAEGFHLGDTEKPLADTEGGPHYKTVWAIEQGLIRDARPIAMDAKAYPEWPERLEIILDDINEWVKNNVAMGRYAGS